MAKLKNGKIQGKIGPYVYRHVNGHDVIQAAPANVKPSGGTLIENKRFGNTSHFTSKVYGDLKEFGLNRCYSYLFGRLLSYFKRVFYLDLVDEMTGEYLNLDKNNDLRKLFSRYLKAEKMGEVINVHIPSLKLKNGDRKYANANFMSYQLKLFLFDIDNGGFYTIYDYKSDRAELEKGIGKQDVVIDLAAITNEPVEGVPLSDLGVSMENVVLMLGFITYFYSYSHATSFLNSKEFNPVAILGAWNLSEEGGESI